MIEARALWELKDAITRNVKASTSGYQATYSHKDADGTHWVTIQGSEEPVPATGLVTSDIGEGDSIRVSLDGGSVSIIGNDTNPSVGAANVLRMAKIPAAEVQQRLATTIANGKKIADQAKRIAEAVAQHVWTADDGLHLTEVTEDEFTDTPQGRNMLLNAYGFLLREAETWLASFTEGATAFYDGLGNAAANIVAQFGADGAVIGRAGESHQVLDYHSLQLVDKEGNAYLYVSDLRGPDGSMLVEWESELTYVQALSTARMDLLLPPTTYQTSIITENIVSVVAHTPSGDVDITNYVNASSSSASELVFTSLPTLGTFTRATATATYYTSDRRVKALTYGSRKTPEDIGVCSSVLGWENDASGLFSHAHGNGCVASGVASNAEGGETEAVADYSHAEGRSSGTGKYAYCGHAEGCNTHANAHSAHSEGYRTTASGEHAHAEGIDSTASGNSSHAEGNNTSATKPYAHAEGRATQATFDEAHAQNLGTIAAKRAQTAIGTFNVEDTSSGTTHPSGDSNAGKYAFIIGNGTSGNARSNAFAVSWDGNVKAAGLYSATCKTSTVALDTTKVSADSPNAVWSNGVCCTVSLSFKMLTSWAPSGTAVSIGTVPDGYRPRELVYISLYVNAGSGGSGGVIGYIGTNGTIYVVNRSTLTFSANQAYRFTATYAV